MIIMNCIKKISELYPEKFILAFELNNSSLDFLQSTNNFEFTKNKNIKLTTLEDLESQILNYQKFNDKLFLQNAINETKDFFYKQLQKMEHNEK